MIEIPQEIVDLFDPEGYEQQARMARLIIAILDEDPVQSISVFTECALDPRGERVALIGVLMNALTGLAWEWYQRAGGDKGSLIAKLREQIAALQEEPAP